MYYVIQFVRCWREKRKRDNTYHIIHYIHQKIKNFPLINFPLLTKSCVRFCNIRRNIEEGRLTSYGDGNRSYSNRDLALIAAAAVNVKASVDNGPRRGMKKLLLQTDTSWEDTRVTQTHARDMRELH